MNKQCEHENCTSTQTEEFHYAWVSEGEPETTWLCYDHAIEDGFCVWCHNFGAGSEDYDFSPQQGYHRDCLTELRYEVGDYDDDEYDDDMDFGWEYPAGWYDGSPTSDLEPPETPRSTYIGPGSEVEQP